MSEPVRKFDVSLVTPEGAVYEGGAEMMVVPGAEGDIGVLARHAPLVAGLEAGATRIYLDRAAGDVLEFATGAGFFKVELDRAIALVEHAVSTSEIDEEEARRQLGEARAELERVERGESEADRWQLEQRIKDARNQLKVVGAE